LPANGTLSALGNVSLTSWTGGDTGTLVFAGTANQSFDLSVATNSLDTSILINKNGGSVRLLSRFVANAANQSVQIQAGTLDLNGGNITVNGTGGTFVVNSGAILKLQGGESVSTPTLDSGSIVSYAGNGDTAATSFSIKNFAYSHLNIQGTDAADVFNLPAAVTVSGNLTISGGNLDASASSFGLTVGGNWTLNAPGTFAARSGSVTFIDASRNSVISGETAFNDLVCRTKLKLLTFEASKTQTIAGTLTLLGKSSAERISLRSASSGVQWSIDTQGSRIVQFVDVMDSNNIQAPEINPIASIDSGNNTHWFGGLVPAPLATPASISSGESTVLSCAPTGGSGTYATFAWTGPGGFTSSLQNPGSVVPPTLGDNIYTVTVTDSLNAQAAATITVTVINLLAGPSAAPATIALGSTATLSSTPTGGSGAYTTFLWSGPGGFSSSVRNPGAVTPPALGNNIYMLTVTDSNGSQSTRSTTINVVPVIAAGAAATPATVQQGSAITLTSNPSGGTGTYTFAWSGPGGFASTLRNPGLVIPPSVGNLQYSLVVTDTANLTATSSLTVVVTASTPGNSNATALEANPLSSQSTIREGGSVTLISNPTGGSGVYTSHLWTGPNGFTSTQRNPGSVTPLKGISVYTLTVTDSSSTQSSAFVTVEVRANRLPVQVTAPAAAATPAGSVTVNFTTLWNDLDGDTLTYKWEFGDNTAAGTSSSPSLSHTYSADGTYTVTLFVSDGFATVPSTLSVVVNGLGKPAISSAATAMPNPAVIAQPISFTVAGTDPAGKPLTTTWRMGDGTSLTGETVVHAYATAGTFTVVATLTRADGLQAASSVVVGVAVGALPPDVDSDHDGVSDELEIGFGTHPNDATSSPLTQPGAAPEPLNINKFGISLSFAAGNKDSISISGLVPVPAGFRFAGKKVAFAVGGVQQSFTLDAKGRSVSKGMTLSTKPGSSGSKYTLALRRGMFSPDLAASGFTNSTIGNQPVVVRVKFIFNGILYQADRTTFYSAKQGKSGKAK